MSCVDDVCCGISFVLKECSIGVVGGRFIIVVVIIIVFFCFEVGEYFVNFVFFWVLVMIVIWFDVFFI